MRALSCILIILGLLSAADAAHDEFYVKRSPKEQYILCDSDLVSNRNPEDFRRALIIEWCGSGMALVFGLAMYVAVRRQDRLDPLSPEFHWDEHDPKA